MDREVKWTDSAWNDLEQIAQYIGKDSEHYAAAIVLEVREAARSLEHFADRGRQVPEFGNPAVRQLIVGTYRLVYHVNPQMVHVLGVIHGAREMPLL